MDSMDDFLKAQPPTALRPLLGQTVLAVEDSRYACEAIRLVCLRSGARIRRADCLSSARRHLRVYQPSVVLVDLGLPDGSGAELIEELAGVTPRVSVILAMSGDDALEDNALSAGADGFLAKPISSIGAFQSAVLAHVPKERHPTGPRAIAEDAIEPDSIAFHDDIAHAQEALLAGEVSYAAQFIESLALCVGDHALTGRAQKLARAPESKDEQGKMAAMLEHRLGTREAV
ncbi:MAG: response regulator [Pseudomonadota bacterium]